jgi:hypothetical protein
VPLLVRADVRNFLPQYDLPDSQIDTAMRLVASWLAEDTGRDDLIDRLQPLPDRDPLFAAAFELTVLEVTNPDQLSASTVGPTTSSWGTVGQSAAARKDAIRERVRQTHRAAAGQAAGCFPPAPCWPDPALPGYRWGPR